MADGVSQLDLPRGSADWSIGLAVPATTDSHGKMLWLSVLAAVMLHAAVVLAGLNIDWTSAPPEPLPAAVPLVLVSEPREPVVPEATASPPEVFAAAPEIQAPTPPQPVAAETPPPVVHLDERPAAAVAAVAPALATAIVPAPSPHEARKPPAPADLPRPKPKAKPAAREIVAPAEPMPRVEPVSLPARAEAAPQAAPEPAPSAPIAMAAATPPSAPAIGAVAAGPVVPPHPVAGLATNRKPDYPAVARSHHLQGRVVLRVQVSASGNPTTVDIVSSSGHPILDDAALAAVRTWRFVPASQAGTTVAAPVEVPVVFRLED